MKNIMQQHTVGCAKKKKRMAEDPPGEKKMWSGPGGPANISTHYRLRCTSSRTAVTRWWRLGCFYSSSAWSTHEWVSMKYTYIYIYFCFFVCLFFFTPLRIQYFKNILSVTKNKSQMSGSNK